MCKFFSFVSDGKGKFMYFDAAMRKRVIAGETEYQDTDSHTSIAHHFGYRGRDEDTLNRYEYNPLTKVLVVDRLNSIGDSDAARRWARQLDFSSVVPRLVIKPIVHPFRVDAAEVNDEIIALLQAWESVRTSVRDSVWDSVWGSAGDSVWDSVRDSVRTGVWESVRDSVRASVWESMRTGVRDSVRASVWESMRAYAGSFFTLDEWKHVDHEPGAYPFQSAVDLWERGFVPSFDSKVWRLHAGPKAKVVYSIEK